ncbi:MAG: glycosyltransferase family 2 protein, partial [Flavobacteriales bacterium]|nr:glycosyltransferase family 2 protein [Flavobacteriales bacterium]
MHSWEWLILGVYGVSMSVIFLYSLVQLSLLIRYRRRRQPKTLKSIPESDYPEVLVQLPVFNEYYVVERLVDAAANLDYPKEKLKIELLDDSTDESFELGAKRVEYWKARDVRIEHVKRPERLGFKAGALQYSFDRSDAPFVAIFDADFVPSPDFLKKSLPQFQDPEIGMVQSRWGHLNRDYSLLTRVQAFALDAHFTVEQTGRNLGNHYINFNGTAGVWRRSCIAEAGGWSAETLTEDLDLSYRAQLKGWKFKFLEDVVSPAELPAEMNALKNQQYRWNKGAAECAVKHLKTVFTRKNIPLSTRIHALFHLGNSSIFIWIVICAILSIPLLFLKAEYPQYRYLFLAGGVLLISFFILAIFYYTSFRNADVFRSKYAFLWLYPAFLSLSMGMSVHNASAVLQGYAGRKTPFIRTPKWNLVGNSGSWVNKKYLSVKIPINTWIEGLLALYFTGALVVGIV